MTFQNDILENHIKGKIAAIKIRNREAQRFCSTTCVAFTAMSLWTGGCSLYLKEPHIIPIQMIFTAIVVMAGIYGTRTQIDCIRKKIRWESMIEKMN